MVGLWEWRQRENDPSESSERETGEVEVAKVRVAGRGDAVFESRSFPPTHRGQHICYITQATLCS